MPTTSPPYPTSVNGMQRLPQQYVAGTQLFTWGNKQTNKQKGLNEAKFPF